MAIDQIMDDLGCSYNLAVDLLLLSGEDIDLIYEASDETVGGVHSLKNCIIDKRFRKIERKVFNG